MRDLRKIASQGIPDSAGIRSTVWKVCVYVCKVTIFGFRFCLVVVWFSRKFGKGSFCLFLFIYFCCCLNINVLSRCIYDFLFVTS